MLRIKRRFAELKRLRQIAGAAYEAGGGLLIDRFRLKYAVPWRCRVHCAIHPPRSDECLVQMRGDRVALAPQRLRTLLESLGPTFVKFGQILSVRADLVGEELSLELSKLQSNVRGFPHEIAKGILCEELGKRPEEAFRSFDEAPVAAASLAQVHRATLWDGTEVAVKVQRPDVRRAIEQDIDLLRHLARAGERFLPELRPYQPSRIVEEFAQWTRAELDFTAEGHHADRIRFAFRDDPHITVPRIHWQYTTRRILTMDFVHGVKTDDREGLKRLEVNPKPLAQYGVGAMLQQFFLDGFFQADPHPGNFFALPGGVLCMHDFGMMGYVDRRQRGALVRCVLAFVDKDIDQYVRQLLRVALVTDQSDVAGFHKDISGVLAELLFSPTRSSVAWAFFRAMNLGVHRRVSFPADLALFGKAIVTAEAMATNLDPDFDFNEQLQSFARRLMRTYVDPRRARRALCRNALDYLELMEDLPDRVRSALDRAERGEIGVKLDLEELRQMIAALDRQNTTRLLGGALLAVFLGTLLLLHAQGTTHLAGLSLSVIGIALSSLLFIWLLARLWRQG